jgi:hypothetical protein
MIDYTPWGNFIFGTAPIGARVWLFLLPCSVGMLIFEELRKWVAYELIGRCGRRNWKAPKAKLSTALHSEQSKVKGNRASEIVSH